jgi:hypothetical protein
LDSNPDAEGRFVNIFGHEIPARSIHPDIIAGMPFQIDPKIWRSTTAIAPRHKIEYIPLWTEQREPPPVVIEQ